MDGAGMHGVNGARAGNVGQGGRRGHVGRHGVEQGSNSKAPRSPNRQVQRSMKILKAQKGGKDNLQSIPKVYKAYLSMTELRNDVDVLCRTFDELQQKGVTPDELNALRDGMQELNMRRHEICYELDSLSQQYGYLPGQNTYLCRRLKSTQKDLDGIYKRLVGLMQRVQYLENQQQVQTDIQQQPDVVPQQGAMINQEPQVQQQQQNVVQGVNVQRSNQLRKFIDSAVQDLNTIQLRGNDPVEIMQCLHRVWGDVRLIGVSCAELGNIDMNTAHQINGALLKVLAGLNSLFQGNQQVQKLQALLTQQGPTPQNMQNVLKLLNDAQNPIQVQIVNQISGGVQQLQVGLQQLERGFNDLIQQGVTQQGLNDLAAKMQEFGNSGRTIEQDLNRLSQIPNAPQEEIGELRNQLGIIGQRLQELGQSGGRLQRIQGMYNALQGVPGKLQDLQQRFSDIFGQPSFQNQELDGLWREFNGICEHFARIYQEENAIRQELGGVNSLNGVSHGQYIGLINQLQAAAQQRVIVQNQLIEIALMAVEWQIAPYFKEGLLAGFRDWWSGASGVQGEIERLRQKSQSQYEVTQEDLQNLLQKLNDFLQRNLPNSEEKSKLIALTSTMSGMLGAAGFGAAAVSASSECAVFGSAAYGIASQGGVLCAVGPVGLGIICLGSLAAAIGGAVYLYRKN